MQIQHNQPAMDNAIGNSGSVIACRALSKRYGSVFLSSLPPSPVVREMVEIKNFFGMLEENQN